MENNHKEPPRRALAFLKWYCRNERLEEIEGDLAEFYQYRLQQFGKEKADRLYWWDAIKCFKPYAIKNNKQFLQISNTTSGMYKNYLKVALRNMLRNKFFSTVNIVGLAVSMSICMLFIHVVYEQFNYDNFHKKGDKIKRVYSWVSQENDPGHALASTSVYMADYLQELGLVKTVTKFDTQFKGECIYKNENFKLKGIFADKAFFDVFSFDLVQGSKATCLKEPYSLVLSDKTAYKYFGDKNPIGEVVQVGELGEYTITGVLAEPEVSTHLPIAAIASFSTIPSLEKQEKIYGVTLNNTNIWTSHVYAEIKADVTNDILQNALEQIKEQHYQIPESRLIYDFYIQDLNDITPGFDMDNRLFEGMTREEILMLSIMPIVVLLLAIFNYTNLSLARAMKRAKEIGVRKVSGAQKQQVFIQFIAESVVFALIAFILAIVLHSIFSLFLVEQGIINQPNPPLFQYIEILAIFFLFSISCGVIAGIVPALYLAGFQPISILKGKFPLNKNPRFVLRKVLVVFQFAVSLVFLITVLIMQAQLSFVFDKNHGFDKANNLVVELKDADYENFKNKLTQLPNVSKVSMTSHLPAIGWNRGIPIVKSLGDEIEVFYWFSVDENYISLMELELLSGKGFSDKIAVGTEEILINEQALSYLGFTQPQEALGELIYSADSVEMRISGVLKDYHFKPVNYEITPMLLRNDKERFQFAVIKLMPGTDIHATLDEVESLWKNLDQQHVFEYSFMDEQMANAFQDYTNLIELLSFITFIALSIACIGLLGMAMYSVENKVKEIGIRKVLGASIKEITFMLVRAFAMVLLLAIILSIPISWFLADMWLQDFAYRITLSPMYFVIASAFLFILGILIIVSQAIKAAYANPIRALKAE